MMSVNKRPERQRETNYISWRERCEYLLQNIVRTLSTPWRYFVIWTKTLLTTPILFLPVPPWSYTTPNPNRRFKNRYGLFRRRFFVTGSTLNFCNPIFDPRSLVLIVNVSGSLTSLVPHNVVSLAFNKSYGIPSHFCPSILHRNH